MGGYQQIAVMRVDPEGVHVERPARCALCGSAAVLAATTSQHDGDEGDRQDRRWNIQQESPFVPAIRVGHGRCFFPRDGWLDDTAGSSLACSSDFIR